MTETIGSVFNKKLTLAARLTGCFSETDHQKLTANGANKYINVTVKELKEKL